jgi:protein-tyrosine phosphatase
MEVRHLRRIAAQPRFADLPRGLLGTYAEFPVPHLHDPYRLSDAYTRVCLARIEHSVAGLCRAFSGARHS